MYKANGICWSIAFDQPGSVRACALKLHTKHMETNTGWPLQNTLLRSTTPRNHRAGDRQHWPASECTAYILKLQQTWSDFLNPSTSWKIRIFTAPTCLNFAVKMFTGMYKFFCQKFLRMKCGILDLKIGCHSGFCTCSSIVVLCMQRYCVMIPDSGNVSEVWNVGWRTPAGGRTLIGLL